MNKFTNLFFVAVFGLSTTLNASVIKFTNSKITSANYSNSRSLGYSSSKTLATIGQGNLIISDTTNSDDLNRLNRNTDEINKDLYNTSISSNIQASIDTRLFTEDGREQIGQDINEVRQGLGEFALKAMLGSENYEKIKVINNELAKLKETDPQRYNEIIIAINEYNKAQEASKDNAIPVVIPVASVVTDFLVEIGIISVAASGAYGAKKLGDKYNSGDFTDNGLDFGDTDVKQSKTNNQNNNQANTQSNSNAQASSPAPLPPDDDDDDEKFETNNKKNKAYREKTKGANSKDKSQVNSIAQKYKIDRREFGDFIESTKQSEGRGASDNFSYKELENLAKEFIEMSK